MGAVNSADIDNTRGEVHVVVNKCDCDEILVLNGKNNISVQYFNTNDPHISENLLYERSYMGEMSDKHHVKKDISVRESQKLTMVVKYKLTDYVENNTQIKRVHGTGHIIFRSVEKKQCTSVQLCIESLGISEDGLAIAKYVGYFEKDFHFSNITNTVAESCVTFMLTFTSPPPPLNGIKKN